MSFPKILEIWLKYLICCQTLNYEHKDQMANQNYDARRLFSPMVWHFLMRLHLLTGPPMPMCSNFQGFKWCVTISPKGGMSLSSVGSQGNNSSSKCISAFSFQCWSILYITKSLSKTGIQEYFHFLTSLCSKYLCFIM